MASRIAYDNYNSYSGADVVVTAQMVPINDGDEMKTHVLGSLQTISYSTHQDKAPVRAIGNINAIDYVMGQRTVAGTMVFAMFEEHWMTPLLDELEDYTNGTVIWSDELPALNLTISLANEYGYKSSMVLYGVKFIDDGGVLSINDLYTENTLQFLAVGIEPLKSHGRHKHSYSSAKDKYKIVKSEPIKKSVEYIPQTNWREINVNVDDLVLHNIYKVNVIKPIIGTANGVINIYAPTEEEIKHNIYIKDEQTNNMITPNKVNNVYSAIVPQGNYTVIAENDETKEKVNLETVTVKADSNVSNTKNIPIIEKVDNTSVTLLTNNDKHDNVSLKTREYINYICSDIDDLSDNINPNVDLSTRIDERYFNNLASEVEYTNEIEMPIANLTNNLNSYGGTNKSITIEGLKPDTQYELVTYNAEGQSVPLVFNTMKNEHETFDIFKDYVLNNSNLHIDDSLKNFDFDIIDKNSDSLVNSVNKIKDDNLKTELMFYAVKLQNELNKVVNDNENNVFNDPADPLRNKLKFGDDVEKINIFLDNDGKKYFVSTDIAQSNYEFLGKDKCVYAAQPISKTAKGCINMFYNYSLLEKNYMKIYNQTVNINTLNFAINNLKYATYKNEFINAIKVKDNIIQYISMLDAPYAYIYNNILIVDIDYRESLAYNNDDYYLCIGNHKDALNHTPIRKIKFKPNDTTLKLNKYYTGILDNNYYEMWIENKEHNKISDVFILSTYSSDEEYLQYSNDLIKKYFDTLKTNTNSLTNKYLTDVYIDLTSRTFTCTKDLKYTILKNIIDSNDNCSLTCDTMLLSVLNLYCDKYEKYNKNCIKNNNIFTFDSMSNYHLNSVTIIPNINMYHKASYTDNKYDMNDNDYGYTILTMTNNFTNKFSGFILINNVSKKYYTYNLSVEVN